jgi:hypothetical protein
MNVRTERGENTDREMRKKREGCSARLLLQLQGKDQIGWRGEEKGCKKLFSFTRSASLDPLLRDIFRCNPFSGTFFISSTS